MTTPIGTISNLVGSTATTTATNSTSPAQDKDMFLKLLVAQMKYQDPSKPTDSTAFLAQMAQFSTVEKLGQIADSQTTATNSSQLQSAVSMIGKTVNYGAGDDRSSGVVTSVTIVDGVPSLLIGGTTVPLADVTGVAATATTPSTPATPSTSATPAGTTDPGAGAGSASDGTGAGTGTS